MMAALREDAAGAAQPPVICLAGPTAAGKSAATLALAQRWPVEIVNVDSATIYRGMDIGTAKPSLEERSRAPQHLLDIRDPIESYSAAAFRHDALALVAAIRARGRIPLLAGGTMLYFKALRDGIDELPGADPALRAELEREAAESGWPAMHAALARVDSVTAARLAPNDSQRIQRALEVYRASGTPMSEWIAAAATRRERGEMGAGDAPVPVVTISLEPSNRVALHARIAGRFDQMLDAGLVEEVRGLQQRGDLHLGLPSMRCVGYRQIWSHLEGEVDLAGARELGIAATRQLAKRQMTWLRALPERKVVDCLSAGAVDGVVEAFAACAPGS
jgi:tRNA dimethylallyltransferase